MKKYLLFSLFIMICMFFIGGNVKAAEDSVLVPFFMDKTTSVLNSDYTVDAVDFGSVEYQESVTLRIFECDKSSGQQDTSTNKYTFTNSNGCEEANATITISPATVATYSNNIIDFLASGNATITAKVSGFDDLSIPFTVKVTGSTTEDGDVNTNTSGTPNIEDDEEDGIVDKDKTVPKTVDKSTVEKDSGEIVGKLTGKNPTTGIDDYVVYLVAISLILGTGVVFKRSFV